MNTQTLTKGSHKHLFFELLILIKLATENTYTFETVSEKLIDAFSKYPFLLYTPLIKKRDVETIQDLMDTNNINDKYLLSPWNTEKTSEWIFSNSTEMPWLRENEQKGNGISLALMLSLFIQLQSNTQETIVLNPIYEAINKAIVYVFKKKDEEIKTIQQALIHIRVRDEQLTKEASYQLIAEFFLQPSIKKKIFQKALEIYCEYQHETIRELTSKDRKNILTLVKKYAMSYSSDKSSSEYFLSSLCKQLNISSNDTNEFIELIHGKQKNEIVELAAKILPDASEEIKQLMSALEVNNSVPNVAVYGVYNSGKSSLLNSLTDKVNPEHFKTRDIRETSEIKKLQHNGLCYIDTPGLDATSLDSTTANNEIPKADIILYVHKLSGGSIQKDDWQAIEKIAKLNGANERIFLVLTESEIATQSGELIKEITAQFQTRIYPKAKPILVSNTTYKKGIEQNKAKLQEISGIPDLRNFLIDLAQTDITEERKEKTTRLKNNILEKIKSKKQELLSIQDQIKTKHAQNEKNFLKEIKDLQKDIIKRIETIKSI